MIRVIQVIQSVVLAQLIPPEQWGLIVTSMIIIGLAKHFSEEPFASPFLVAHPDSSKELLGNLFAVSVIRSLLFLTLIYFTADLISIHFFNQADLSYPLLILSCGIVVNAIENPEFRIAEGKSEFNKIVRIETISTLIAAITGISIALYEPSIEALIAVNVLPWVIRTVFSYIHFPKEWKTDFSFGHLKKIFNYGKAFWGIGLLTILTAQGDDLFVSKMGGAEGAYDVGLYARAYFWAVTLSFIVLESISRALFPKIVEVKNNPTAIKGYINKSLISLNLFIIPSHLLVFFFAEEFILISSGEKWLPMEIYLKIFLLLSFVRANARIISHAMTALGQASIVFKIKCLESIIFACLIWPAYQHYHVEGVAWTVVIVYSFSYLFNSLGCYKHLKQIPSKKNDT